jgi:hypothetical protein
MYEQETKAEGSSSNGIGLYTIQLPRVRMSQLSTMSQAFVAYVNWITLRDNRVRINGDR